MRRAYFPDGNYGSGAGSIHLTESRLLAGMPALRWDLIKGRRYGKSVTIATRGCPHRCDYCSIPLLYGPGTVHYRPIDEVVREVATSPTRAVVFWDDNLGAKPRYAKELFRALTPLRKWWTSQCTASAARDEEFVELAARSGCKALFLGLESISQDSLDATNKAHNRVGDYRRLIAHLHRHGIAVHLGIMFGFDQDDVGIFRRTGDFLDEACVARSLCGFCTLLRTRAKKKGGSGLRDDRELPYPRPALPTGGGVELPLFLLDLHAHVGDVLPRRHHVEPGVERMRVHVAE